MGKKKEDPKTEIQQKEIAIIEQMLEDDKNQVRIKLRTIERSFLNAYLQSLKNKK